METLRFNGVIRNVSYDTRIRPARLHVHDAKNFNINQAKATGIIQFDEHTEIGYAYWTSPKRTRTYPLARTYDIYHLPKRVVIIPIIKDEGLGANNDRINYITFSWMSLANVYIILAWYEDAKAHPRKDGRITKQKLNTAYINQKLEELRVYQQTALHWNIFHFEKDFVNIYQQAVKSYQEIAEKTKASLVSPRTHLAVLDTYSTDEQFDLEKFKHISLEKSYAASQRELQTQHKFEYLNEENKAYFYITNWLGGEYHLTSDEILIEDDTIVIQESKNSSSKKLPSLSDIKDGLFKLILYANLDKLYWENQEKTFKVRLKLTAPLNGTIRLPNQENRIKNFSKMNNLKQSEEKLLLKLNEEATNNKNLEIEISANA